MELSINSGTHQKGKGNIRARDKLTQPFTIGTILGSGQIRFPSAIVMYFSLPPLKCISCYCLSTDSLTGVK